MKINTYFSICRALGLLASKMTSSPAPPPPAGPPPPHEATSVLLKHVLQLVSTNFALQRMVGVLVVSHWEGCPGHTLSSALLAALTSTDALEDMVPYILAMQKDCQVSPIEMQS